jgi:aminopeptidase N
MAIEHKAGRDKLDAVLNAAIRKRSWWTTEDLREALEDRTGQDWSTFFRDYVYGRAFPPTINKQ